MSGRVSTDSSQLSIPEPPAQLTSREVLRSPDVRAMLVYGSCLYTGLMLQAAVLGDFAELIETCGDRFLIPLALGGRGSGLGNAGGDFTALQAGADPT